MKPLSRRQLLEILGVAAGAAATPASPARGQTFVLPAPPARPYTPPGRPVTCVIIGHGGRGSTYSGFALQIPQEWKVVGVAEPIDYRREACVTPHAIPRENVFTTWEHVFERPKLADVAVVTTQDAMHLAPALAALDRGYDLLLEKPIAQSWEQCRQIYRKVQATGAIVAVCHVLRYAPYYVQLRHVIASGLIGDVVSVQHLEPIGDVHMSHSYVRGPWRSKAESTPMIVSKSCHDLDVLRWWVGRPCTRVSAFGGLTKFRAAQAPPGAPAFCLDGCAASATCHYDAARVYVREKLFSAHHVVTPDRSPDGILAALRRGPFGRCVYRCDNDAPDHMVTNLEFEGGVTAAFSIEGCVSYQGRRSRVLGTKGDILGDERTMEVTLFEGGRATWDVTQAADDLGRAVAQRRQDLIPTTLQASMESHLMGFLAEESRVAGGAVRTVALDL
jgi:predicted dehydrogenase